MQRDNRIVLSFVFGLVGGVLIVTTPLLFLPSVFQSYGGYYGPFFYGLFGFATAIASGTLVIFGATMGFRHPSQGLTWGIVTIVFGSLSVMGLGGFLLGMALAIVGGALSIVVGATGPAVGAPGQRACLGCGMLVDRDFAHCPHCGHAMPSFSR